MVKPHMSHNFGLIIIILWCKVEASITDKIREFTFV